LSTRVCLRRDLEHRATPAQLDQLRVRRPFASLYLALCERVLDEDGPAADVVPAKRKRLAGSQAGIRHERAEVASMSLPRLRSSARII
jgi:hypothetical protein